MAPKMDVSESAAVPIYQQLFHHYRDLILSNRLQAGQRIDSIAEIQKKHKVARETAKRVLSLLAEDGYIAQFRGKGSFVADLGPKQRIWGLIFPFFSIQYEDLIIKITNHAAAAGRKLQPFCDYNDYREEIRLVGNMLHERYEAVVVIPTMDESKTWDFYKRLSPQAPPVVLLDHTMTCNDFPFVIQSYDMGVTQAISYLAERTEGGIAFVENEAWTGRNMMLDLMRWTYADLIQAKRPGTKPFVLPHASQVRIEDLRGDGVTGIFCCDDASAIQVIGRLKEQGGEVPREFNVVSYGNTDLGRFFSPSITSVDPKNAEMSAVLADLLRDEKKVERNVRHVTRPELIVRET
jgi:GntR family transcriptional regulator of arabinose operon